MQPIEILKSSIMTLKLNRRRTFLTMIGIIIGISAVITIMSLGNGFRQQTLDSLAKDAKGRPRQEFTFQVTNYETDFEKLMPFTEKDVETISTYDGVDEVKIEEPEYASVKYTTLKYRDVKDLSFGYEAVNSTDKQMIVGRNLTVTDNDGKKPYMIIDTTSAMMMFEDSEQALNKVVTLDNVDYTIIGVFEPPMEENPDGLKFTFGATSTQLFVPKATYDRYNPDLGVMKQLVVYFQKDADMKSINRNIQRYLNEEGNELRDGDYTYFDSTEMMEEIGKQLNMITYFVTAIAGISLFIAGVGVMNMMYISVSERTKEIGIRRSLGATQRSIQWQFLLEGIVMTLIGGLIGYVLGIAIALGVSKFLPFNALVDISTALLSVIIAGVIGIVFSVFPAKAAAKKNVVDILR